MSDPRRRVIVFGSDGLRPDLVDPELMPNYARLMATGAVFPTFQAAYPPHTRVNMTTLTTGTRPGTHGIVANLMYVPGAGNEGWLDTSDEQQLRAFAGLTGGPLVLAPTLGDRLAAHGARLAVAGSGSTGGSLLWNFNRPARVINPGSSYGDPDLALLHEKLGPVPAEHGRTKYQRARWATAALTDVLLDDPDNRVMTLWLSEPDSSQHFYGLGSPESAGARRVVDECLGQVLAALAARGLEDETDLLLVSDHGHSSVKAHRSLRDYLADADAALGLGGAFSAGGDFIYRLDDGADARPLLEWLIAQPWCDIVFTSDDDLVATDGCLPLAAAAGTQRHGRAPLLAVSPRWRADNNEFGVPGSVESLTSLSALKSSHGAASPFDLGAFCAGYGPGFRSGVVSDLPAGTVDIAPTICALLRLDDETGFDGRVLAEGLRGRETATPVAEQELLSSGSGRASVRLARLDGQTYFMGTTGDGEA